MLAFYDAHPIAFWILFILTLMCISASRPLKGTVQIKYAPKGDRSETEKKGTRL